MTGRHKIVISETLEQAINIIEDKEVRNFRGVCESCAAEWDAAIAQIMLTGKRNTELRETVKALRKIINGSML